MNLTLSITKNKSVSSDIQLAREGNSEAFCRLIESNRLALIRVAKAILSHQMDMEDAIQETIIIAYKNIKKLKKDEFYKSWLIKILINECNKILKRKKNTVPLEQIDICDYSSMDSIENLTLMQAINSLDMDYRITTVLYYFEDLSYKEISSLLEIAEGTVKSRLSRARIKLYDLLK